MYKILLLERGGTKQLWSLLTEKKIIDEKETIVEFETDDIDVFEAKLIDLFNTTPKEHIRTIQDVTYSIDVLLN